MNKALQLLMKAISDPEAKLDVEKSRKLMNLKSLDPFKAYYRTLDQMIVSDGYEIPVRIYFPYEGFEEKKDENYPVIFYIHGGGFVTESIESYNRVCWNLTKNTQQIVVSVEYPLAPEFRFPTQIEVCYAAAKAIFKDRSILNVNPEQITVMGDSAGGNMAAALSMMARDRGEFMPERQILIYPCVNNNYKENNGFLSVMENGQDYLLTRQNMEDYLEYYQASEADRDNPYFAPLIASNFENLPKTLVITGEFDPLRDEGEAFAEKLREGGNEVILHRIKDAVHGFFLLEPLHMAVKETYEYINEFLHCQADKEAERGS